MKENSVNKKLKSCHIGLYALLMAILTACGQSEMHDNLAAVIQVSATTITPTYLELTEDLPGRVVAVRIAEIRPQVTGIVERRLFEQGTEVYVGQPLFQINPAPFRAEVDTAAAALQRAEAVLNHARLKAARLQSLIDANAVSRQAYDDAVSQLDQAAADVAQARATLAHRQLDLQFSTVKAPISGRIDQALITEGALVSSGDSSPMAVIQHIDQVYVDVRCPAASLELLHRELAKQNTGSNNGVPVDVLRSDGKPYDVKGRILFSGINIDPGTGDVLLRVLVDNNQQQLLPGMFVNARVPLASYDKALTVPQQAIVWVEGQPQVWRLEANNQAYLSGVEVGELVARRYRIKSGLNAGDRIVVEGMERLYDGVEVNAQEWKK
jgi:multidrug efflux system membrane fusion protein